MQAFLMRWPLLVAALWWGGITLLSFVAVPLAFAHFDNPTLAGPYAAKLFQVVSWLSVVSAMALLLWGRLQRLRSADVTGRWVLLPWLLAAALAALLQENAVAQTILTARNSGANLKLWHSLGSALVVVQWFAALRAVWWLGLRTEATNP
jgi:F0F1-type ATP synthase assembly protein I